MARRTLAREALVRGIGLHSGREALARCLAAEPGQGIVFRRVDLPGAPPIPARLSNVRSTDRRTVLGEGDGSVETVEHLLAAAAALQIDDLTIELDGPEPPIGDGSFAPYVEAMQAAGTVEQPGDPVIYRVLAPFHLSGGRCLLRRVARPGIPAHHDDRVESSADRTPGRQLRHHPGRIRPGAGAGPDLRFPARGGGAAGPGARAGSGAGVHPRPVGGRVGGRCPPLAGRIRAPQGGRYRRRSRAGRRAGAGARGRDQTESPGKHRAGALAPAHRTARWRHRDGHREDPGRDSAPVPHAPRRSNHRGRGDQPDRRDQERHDQRAVLPGPLSRATRSCPAC